MGWGMLFILENINKLIGHMFWYEWYSEYQQQQVMVDCIHDTNAITKNY